MSNATGEISYGGVTGLPYKKISRTRKKLEFYTWIRITIKEANKIKFNNAMSQDKNKWCNFKVNPEQQ